MNGLTYTKSQMHNFQVDCNNFNVAEMGEEGELL